MGDGPTWGYFTWPSVTLWEVASHNGEVYNIFFCFFIPHSFHPSIFFLSFPRDFSFSFYFYFLSFSRFFPASNQPSFGVNKGPIFYLYIQSLCTLLMKVLSSHPSTFFPSSRYSTFSSSGDFYREAWSHWGHENNKNPILR